MFLFKDRGTHLLRTGSLYQRLNWVVELWIEVAFCELTVTVYGSVVSEKHNNSVMLLYLYARLLEELDVIL